MPKYWKYDLSEETYWGSNACCGYWQTILLPYCQKVWNKGIDQLIDINCSILQWDKNNLDIEMSHIVMSMVEGIDVGVGIATVMSSFCVRKYWRCFSPISYAYFEHLLFLAMLSRKVLTFGESICLLIDNRLICFLVCGCADIISRDKSLWTVRWLPFLFLIYIPPRTH